MPPVERYLTGLWDVAEIYLYGGWWLAMLLVPICLALAAANRRLRKKLTATASIMSAHSVDTYDEDPPIRRLHLTDYGRRNIG